MQILSDFFKHGFDGSGEGKSKRQHTYMRKILKDNILFAQLFTFHIASTSLIVTSIIYIALF